MTSPTSCATTRTFIDKSFNGGQQVLDLLNDHRNDIVPLVVGLREYLQTLTEIIRIPVGDGTLMGAVKSLSGPGSCVSCLLAARGHLGDRLGDEPRHERGATSARPCRWRSRPT